MQTYMYHPKHGTRLFKDQTELNDALAEDDSWQDTPCTVVEDVKVPAGMTRQAFDEQQQQQPASVVEEEPVVEPAPKPAKKKGRR
jgi:hypothetical protein